MATIKMKQARHSAKSAKMEHTNHQDQRLCVLLTLKEISLSLVASLFKDLPLLDPSQTMLYSKMRLYLLSKIAKQEVCVKMVKLQIYL